MPTISLEEAAEKFSELITTLDAEPLVVMDGDHEVALITSPSVVERERQQRWSEFWKTRDVFAAEAEANLAKTGVSVDEFLASALNDE